MKIRQGVETPEGSFVFQGEISGAELNFLVEIGINELAKRGALPYVAAASVASYDIHAIPDTQQ